MTDVPTQQEPDDDGACWRCDGPADGLDWLAGAPICSSCADYADGRQA